VNRGTTWRDVLLAWLAEYFELLLTVAGVLVAILIVFADLDPGEQGRLLTFIVWLQGFILWAVHRHAVLGRRALIRKMRVMLQDRVNNQLTIMLGAAESRGRDGNAHERADLESAVTAARSVATELENLSLDSLHRWEHRYRRLLPRLLR
jgi:phosphoglycerol transferase MdoB-like AlkP superfamily enzyme